MNVLVFDGPGRIAVFVRSVLRSQSHRVSISSKPEDARLKLETTLFDSLVVGPEGAPADLDLYVQQEQPHLPVVMAGVPAGVAAQGQVVAVLTSPLSVQGLISTFRLVDRIRRERLSQLSAEVSVEGVRLACRLADLTEDSFVLAGDSDAFVRHFGQGPRRVEAVVAGMALGGEVAFTEDVPLRRARRVGVKIEGGDARSILKAILK